MHKFLYLLVLLLFTTGLSSCIGDSMKEADLLGNWSLVNGKLNNEATEMFEGFTMTFTEEQKLRSVIISQIKNGVDEVPYTLTPEHKIKLLDLPIEFTIHRLEADTLEISFDMMQDGTMFNLGMVFKREQ